MLYFLGTLDYATAFAAAPTLIGKTLTITQNIHWDAATVICLLLFIGAMGKSAQVPLHVWLPDSMEGPTPISALIHAATMVTAGIFMVARMSPLYELSDTALSFVLVIGATGALFTGLIGIVQNDIKRVVAYSTLSQLGYMTVALGVSAYAGAVFHLMTHAFFKALLFLGAGSVIIAMHHEQDMRYMGGLRKYMPITWITMWIGSLALCGVPFFAGFYSKDAIIDAVHESHRWGSGYAYFCVLAGAFVTATYTFRQMYLTFHGKERFTVVSHHGHDHHDAHDDHHDDHGHHEPGVLDHAPKESPWVVTLPLILLAIPSLSDWVFSRSSRCCTAAGLAARSMSTRRTTFSVKWARSSMAAGTDGVERICAAAVYLGRHRVSSSRRISICSTRPWLARSRTRSSRFGSSSIANTGSTTSTSRSLHAAA